MTKRYAVHNLRCAGCAARIEDAIAGLPGVKSAAINLDSARLRVEGEQPELAAMIRLADAIEPGTLFSEMDENEPLPESSEPQPSLFRSEYKLWIAAALFAVGMIFEERLDALLTPFVAKAVFFGIPYLLCGLSVLKKGLQSLLKFDFFNEYTLMGGATIAAAAIGQLPEAVGVMLFYSIGEALQDRAAGNSRRSIRALLAARPTVAHLIEEKDGKQMVNDADPAEIRPGMRILVKPGEKIPLDGTVLTGSSQVDTSPLTGESVPVSVGAGKQVYAGTVNLEGAITVEVTSRFADSSVARILELVEQASANKAPIERFITRFARYYTPAVVFIAALVAVIPPLAGHGTFDEWLYRALVLLVISCPCALVISTPVTVVSALATATRCGLLIKGGLYLEEARKLVNIGLDKTGTLTKGEPAVAGVKYLATFDERLTGAMAASLAAMNKHPLSLAIARWAHERHLPVYQVEGFTAIPGAGVEGRIERGMVRLVNLRWLEEQGLADEEVRRTFAHYTNEGMSAVAVADAFGVQAVFGLADVVKEDTVEGLRQLASVGIRPWLLTGDNEAAARALAEKVGLKDVRADLLPEDKLKAIEELQKSGLTAMAGDGINDAPALARADIGIAMGVRGTDSAIEAAHIAVMDDRISSIATLVRLSRITHGVLVENIAFAIGVKIIFALLALTGNATMWMAVFADTGTCLIVVANAMRMLRMKPRLDRMAEEARRAA